MPRNRARGKASRSSTPTPRSRSASPTQSSSRSESSSSGQQRHPHPLQQSPIEPVLTSDKRRGIFECDYCHADISQVPRIRCAVCHDFDLCLDCFSSSSTPQSGAAVVTAPVSATQQHQQQQQPQHDHTHGYRVADSTRYPMFPRSTALRDIGDNMSNDGMSNEGDNDAMNVDTSVDAQTKKDGGQPGTDIQDVTMTNAEATAPETAPPVDSDNVSNSNTNKQQDTNSKDDSDYIVIQDDSKHSWTVEEDLRLLNAIDEYGLGNWADISEAISGQGSSHKTARRCMERYFDDFLGRYGHILPAYIIDNVEEESAEEKDAPAPDAVAATEGERTPSLKRMRVSAFGAPSTGTSSRRSKRVKVIPTASLPGYENYWPRPYLPPISRAQMGQDVGRDLCYRSEQAFVKLIGNASSKEEAEAIRQDWEETRLDQPGGPTVLPMRLEDLPTLPGSELAGFMPRRGDLDVEYENDAEDVIADMEFSANDSPQDRELKIQIIQIYNSKLDERERRKKYLLSRGLFDYRKNQVADSKLPRDEKDLIRRMRIFERLHTPEEHKTFMEGILKAKRLRKEIAKLQMYRRIGITTLAEAEKYELDKNRREFHKMSQLQKEAEKVKSTEASSYKDSGGGEDFVGDDDISSSLWKQYRTSDRKNRRSVNRTSPGIAPAAGAAGPAPAPPLPPPTAAAEKAADGGRKSEGTGPSKELMTAAKEGGTKKEEQSDQDEKKPDAVSSGSLDKSTFEITKMPGYHLLSKKEAKLCAELEIKPSQYTRAKKAIIAESFRRDLLDKSTAKRTVVKIDVEKKGKVIDFIVKAGWIPNKVGDILKQ